MKTSCQCLHIPLLKSRLQHLNEEDRYDFIRSTKRINVIYDTAMEPIELMTAELKECRTDKKSNMAEIFDIRAASLPIFENKK